MRAVAKSLRLDLSSFREYEAFAQFAADLDEETRAILERGNRMMEILKQDQYRPMAVVDQVIQIFAGTRGHLDDMALDEVRSFSMELVDYVHEKHADLAESIASSGDLSDEDANKLAAVIAEFKQARQREKDEPAGVTTDA